MRAIRGLRAGYQVHASAIQSCEGAGVPSRFLRLGWLGALSPVMRLPVRAPAVFKGEDREDREDARAAAFGGASLVIWGAVAGDSGSIILSACYGHGGRGAALSRWRGGRSDTSSVVDSWARWFARGGHAVRSKRGLLGERIPEGLTHSLRPIPSVTTLDDCAAEAAAAWARVVGSLTGDKRRAWAMIQDGATLSARLGRGVSILLPEACSSLWAECWRAAWRACDASADSDRHGWVSGRNEDKRQLVPAQALALLGMAAPVASEQAEPPLALRLECPSWQAPTSAAASAAAMLSAWASAPFDVWAVRDSIPDLLPAARSDARRRWVVWFDSLALGADFGEAAAYAGFASRRAAAESLRGAKVWQTLAASPAALPGSKLAQAAVMRAQARLARLQSLKVSSLPAADLGNATVRQLRKLPDQVRVHYSVRERLTGQGFRPYVAKGFSGRTLRASPDNLELAPAAQAHIRSMRVSRAILAAADNAAFASDRANRSLTYRRQAVGSPLGLW